MGDITTITVADNADLQRAVGSAIAHAKATDPLAPVTLIVDTAAQAWALRRQVAESVPAGTGLANVRAMTLTDLLTDLAERGAISCPESTDPLLRGAVVEALLRAESGPLSASAEHPETALRLADLAEELTWCALESEVDALDQAGVSLTARSAIRFAADVRPALAAALGSVSWPQATAAIRTALADGSIEVADSGALIVACARVPAPVQDVLEGLAELVPVARVVMAPDERPIEARVLDFPDPATEIDYAVRLAAQAIAGGTSPGRIAIVYSTDTPYARLLERSLDAAGIAWHGPTGQTLRTTTVARCMAALAGMAAARAGGSSGLDRPRLMRLLALSHLADGPAPVAAGPCRLLIRREGLFGDAVNWLGHLDAISRIADDTLVDDPGTDEPESADSDRVRPRHIPRHAPHAADLVALIRALDSAMGTITDATTWADLGARLWSTLESFHLHGTWWSVRPDDAATVEALRALLLDGFPRIDALAAHAPLPTAHDAAQVIDRALAARRARHGASSVGIHVGAIASARGLVFDHVVIVGASDGLLPPVRGVDPLLPDAARLRLRRASDDLPRSSELEASIATDVRALASAAGTVVATLSRGALPASAVGLPSRYLRADGIERVASARASLTHQPAPVTTAHLAERAALSHAVPDPVLQPRIASIAAWAAPEPGPYFGDLGPGADRWSLHDKDISASGIEQFLHCPYHFFVQRILGISTDEFEDTVDTIAPNDMGTLLHTAFERFVNDSRTAGTLPDPGQSWPASALADLRRIVDDQVRVAIGKGLTGWRPAWERSHAIAVAALPAFLNVDTTAVRADPPTAPIAAEQAFGSDSGHVVEFRVSDDVVVRLRGSIDRVDQSADAKVIGVVDYKSGASKGFAEKLGSPRQNGTPRNRTKVQDLVYDAAARILYPDADHIDVHFLFVPNGGESPLVVTPTHDDDRAAVLRDVLGALDAAGQNGRFLPTPQGSHDYCPVCKRLGRRALIVSDTDSAEDEEDTA